MAAAIGRHRRPRLHGRRRRARGRGACGAAGACLDWMGIGLDDAANARGRPRRRCRDRRVRGCASWSIHTQRGADGRAADARRPRRLTNKASALGRTGDEDLDGMGREGAATVRRACAGGTDFPASADDARGTRRSPLAAGLAAEFAGAPAVARGVWIGGIVPVLAVLLAENRLQPAPWIGLEWWRRSHGRQSGLRRPARRHRRCPDVLRRAVSRSLRRGPGAARDDSPPRPRSSDRRSPSGTVRSWKHRLMRSGQATGC